MKRKKPEGIIPSGRVWGQRLLDGTAAPAGDVTGRVMRIPIRRSNRLREVVGWDRLQPFQEGSRSPEGAVG